MKPFWLIAPPILLAPAAALAFPSVVQLAPTGTALGFGETSVLVSTGMLMHPEKAAGPSFAGFEIGTVPHFEFAKDGPAFGGLEIGMDLYASDLAGTPDAFVKPVINVKLALVEEYKALPALALGAMEIAPFQSDRSLNFVYFSASKSASSGETELGRFTFGLAASLLAGEYPDLYYATFPFPEKADLALLAGYESPTFGPFYFAVDHVGGASEIGGTNVALGLFPVEGVTWNVGASLGNDPDAFFVIAYTSLFVQWSFLDALRGEPKAEPEPPKPAEEKVEKFEKEPWGNNDQEPDMPEE